MQNTYDEYSDSYSHALLIMGLGHCAARRLR